VSCDEQRLLVSCKVPDTLADFHETVNFLDIDSKKIKTQMSIFIKSVRWKPSCSMRTDGQTMRIERHDEANIRFWQL